MIFFKSTSSNTRAGIAQIATSAVLVTFLSFTTGWRTWLAVELAAVLLVAGVALVVYGTARREIPFRGLAAAWLPIGVPFLLAFLVFFGAGLAVAEDGNDGVGIALMIAGYMALPARSVYRLLARRGAKNNQSDI